MPEPHEYRPRPVDTSRIALDPSLLKLVEYLARNTHEVWAVGRVNSGWTWGPARDDSGKRHPSLIPYEHLSESEKQVDRDTAVQAIKLITALGYRIQPPQTPAILPSGVEEAEPAVDRLDLPDLIALWRAWGQDQCRGEPAAYAAVASRALDLGECLLAYDMLQAGLEFYPSDMQLRRLQSLALARSGAAEAARSVLEQLRAEGSGEEPEVLGLLARCQKDLWEQSADVERGRAWLSQACDSYESAARLRPAGTARYWEMINAATLAACLGQDERARADALAARDECIRLLEAPAAEDAGDPYWPLATLGEAWLVLGDVEQAVTCYQSAVRSAGKRFGRISSTRRNARLLLKNRGWGSTERNELLARCLRLPRVVVFSGHMIDRPDRAAARFPADREPAVAAEIRRRLDELDCGIGYASGACGADILFLEAVLQRGGEANLILPYGAEQFLPESVSFLPGSNWEQRFRDLLASKQVRVVVASRDSCQGDPLAIDYANQLILGLGGIRAWQLGAELATLAVWDGRPGDGPGGTADVIARWRRDGLEPAIINPLDEVSAQETQAQAPAGRDPGAPGRVREDARTSNTNEEKAEGRTPSHAAPDRKLVAILFADATGFSKLAEDEVPVFVRHVLGRVAELAAASGRQPLHVSTWGDGMYLVFGSLGEAAEFALEMRDHMAATDWQALGLRRKVVLRTALHAGPVYVCSNPVTGQRDYVGTHVSRAARLEPVTPAGQVYATEAFAAIAFAEHAAGFRCDYVGQVGLAKDFGVFPTYHVARRVTLGR